MQIDILTLFPSLFDSVFSQSIIKKAVDKKIVEIKVTNIRNFAEGSVKKYGLIGVDRMKIRQAGRTIFAYVLFKADKNASLGSLEVIRENMNKDMSSIDDRIELVVLF